MSRRKDKSTKRLPTYLFVCGIEGAGHHALETVWEELGHYLDFKLVTFNPGLHAFAKDPKVPRAYQHSSIALERQIQVFDNFLRQPDVLDKELIIDARNSYPEGFGSGSLAHPDLVHLAALDGYLFDLRVLVIQRNLTDAVLSAVRRFNVKQFTFKNLQYQARVVQDAMTMINNALAYVPCGKTLALSYDELVAFPTAFATPLAHLLTLDAVTLTKCFGGIRTHSKRKLSHAEGSQREEMTSATTGTDLDEFFHRASPLWPVLASTPLFPPPTQVLPPSPKLLPTLVRRQAIVVGSSHTCR